MRISNGFARVFNEQLRSAGLRQLDVARAAQVSPAWINKVVHSGRISPEWVEIIARSSKASPETRAKLHRAAAVARGYKLDLTEPEGENR